MEGIIFYSVLLLGEIFCVYKTKGQKSHSALLVCTGIILGFLISSILHFFKVGVTC